MTTPPRFRSKDRMVLFGATGCGKTYVANRVWSSVRPPRLVLDPKDALPQWWRKNGLSSYAVTFHDPARLPDVPVARWVPRDPMDRDAYDRVYRAVWESDRRWFVWLDEASHAAPARSGMPPHMARHITQGRERHLGHITANQRPVEVSPNLVGQAEHVVVFRLGHPKDLDTAAGQLSMNPRDVRRRLGSTPTHGCIWYDRTANRAYVVGAVK